MDRTDERSRLPSPARSGVQSEALDANGGGLAAAPAGSGDKGATGASAAASRRLVEALRKATRLPQGERMHVSRADLSQTFCSYCGYPPMGRWRSIAHRVSMRREMGTVLRAPPGFASQVLPTTGSAPRRRKWTIA